MRRPKFKEGLFGPGGELRAQKGRPTLGRNLGEHETWVNAILPADADAGSIETETSRRPLFIIIAIVLVLLSGLIFQLGHLQITEGEHNLALANGNRLREKVVRAPRGILYDRTGVALTRNTANYDVTITPRLLPRDDQNPGEAAKKRQEVYRYLAELTSDSAEHVYAVAEGDCIANEQKTNKKMVREEAEAVCLSRPQAQLVKEKLDRQVALNLDQQTERLPGVSLDVNPIREYLDGGLLAATLGYTGRVNEQDLEDHPTYQPTDLIGKLGLEKQYESDLRGKPGEEQSEVDANGQPIKLLSSKSAEAGNNLVLSIDQGLQQKFTAALVGQAQAAGATRAAGVALNPKTGEVLALVNVPSYDNNLFAKGISQTDYTKLVNDPAQPLFNKAVSGAYPSGSIIKPFIASAALQEKVADTSTSVNDTGQLVVPNKYDPSITYTFRSYEPGGLGNVNISRAIAVSSNVFFFTVGGGFGKIGGLGADRLIDYYHKFGLGKKTGIDIPGETSGRIPTPESKQKATGEAWTLGDTYNISVGQGDVGTSPLQMATALQAIANGGTVYQPHVVKKITDGRGATVREITPKVTNTNFISPENIAVVRNAMRDTVNASFGTACCKIKQEVPVTVAGKTGTAETDPNGNRKANSWFEAFAPFDEPQIVIVALVENGGEGSQFAAPAVRETLAYCFTRPGGCVQ